MIINDKRLHVIEFSILMERFISSILATLLDVDLENSKTLGNKSSSFSFNQKVNLLIDMKTMSKDDSKKYITFAEIRNQFAHNLDVSDFTTCFKYLDGKANFLSKQYIIPEFEKLGEEEQLATLYNHLYNDLNNISLKLLTHLKDKIMKEGMAEGSIKVYKFLYDEINNLAKNNEDFRVQYYQPIINKMEKQFEE